MFAINIKMFFGKGPYFIPFGQRCYDWDIDDVEYLLFAIDQLMRCSQQHWYINAMVILDNPENERSEVYDGYQRLSTIVMILSVLAKKINQVYEENQEELYLYRYNIHEIFYSIKREFLVREENDYRFYVHEDDAMIFQKYILNFEEKDKIPLSGLSLSNKKMAKAYNKIQDHIDLVIENIESSYEMFTYLREYYNTVVERIMIGEHRVNKIIEAKMIFTSNNSSGKPLQPIDFLKNEFNMVIHQEVLKSK